MNSSVPQTTSDTVPVSEGSKSHARGFVDQIRQTFLGRAADSQELRTDFRVVLYSHDAMGSGHMRRNLLIAKQIQKHFPQASILLIAGAAEACTFSRIANIDCLTLPSFQKNSDGTYSSRSLGISASDILALRSKTILAAVQSYGPDLLIVDKIPAGAGGEMLPTLKWLTEQTTCHRVLGLRDILDDSEKIIFDWAQAHTFETIRDHFDEIWIYGEPHIYDAVKEYRFPRDISKRVAYTGYLDPQLRLEQSAFLNGMSTFEQDNQSPFVLCTIGGGQDGHRLAFHFIESIGINRRKAILLTGPFMPRSVQAQLSEAARKVPSLQIRAFVEEADWLIKNASHVISMGGYNTVTSILSHARPALIVPRVTPRREQLIRAERFAELGLLQTVHPGKLSSDSILNWLNTTSLSGAAPMVPFPMRGLDTVCDLIHARFPQAKLKRGVSA